MPYIYKNAKASYLLLIINVIAYISIRGDTFYRLAFFAPAVSAGEWERVISAMFLHLNIEHLMSNMLSLFLVGTYAEALFGASYMTLIYLCSGAAGNLLTYLIDIRAERYIYSVGASGAIAGLVGAVIAYIIVSRLKGKSARLPVTNIIFAAFIVTVPGITETGVNAIGHIGGFIGGAAAGAVVSIIIQNKTIRKTLV